jgi:hypothetical protein
MKLLVSEDRIRGRRLVLKNGVLVVEKCPTLPPEQIAQVVDAVLDQRALSAEATTGNR